MPNPAFSIKYGYTIWLEYKQGYNLSNLMTGSKCMVYVVLLVKKIYIEAFSLSSHTSNRELKYIRFNDLCGNVLMLPYETNFVISYLSLMFKAVVRCKSDSRTLKGLL